MILRRRLAWLVVAACWMLPTGAEGAAYVLEDDPTAIVRLDTTALPPGASRDRERDGAVGPLSFFVRGSGEIVTLDAADGVVVVFSDAGKAIGGFRVFDPAGPAESPILIDLAENGSGEIALADGRHGRVLVFDGQGAFLREVPLQDDVSGLPQRVGFDSDGRLYAFEPAARRTWVFGPDGKLLSRLERDLVPANGVAAQFLSPSAIDPGVFPGSAPAAAGLVSLERGTGEKLRFEPFYNLDAQGSNPEIENLGVTPDGKILIAFWTTTLGARRRFVASFSPGGVQDWIARVAGLPGFVSNRDLVMAPDGSLRALSRREDGYRVTRLKRVREIE